MHSKAYYLGIHAGHDANVTVVDENGKVQFAAGEERFNRIKMYPGFPSEALKYVFHIFGTDCLGMVVPRLSVPRKMVREFSFFMNSFRKGLAAPRFILWLKMGAKKMLQGRTLEQGQKDIGIYPVDSRIYNIEHHMAHAASAYYASGFDPCYVMTLDGEGDGYSCCFFRAENGKLKRIACFYHNEVTIGRDYEKVTAMLGFHPLRHPGKITGLAAYGRYDEACIETLDTYLKKNWKADRMHMISSASSYQVISSEGRKKLMQDRKSILGAWSREDIAFAIQYLTEKKVGNLIRKWVPDRDNTCIALAGGVFANVALNKSVKEMGFKKIFIQPAMTDAGLSLGACWNFLGEQVKISPLKDVYLGPRYSPDEIKRTLEKMGVSFYAPEVPAHVAAKLLAEGKVIARFDGAMEFGPRALGNRSILYHTQDKTVNDWLNKKLSRTEFMPFAPVTLERFAAARYKGYEGAEHTSRFMTITFECSDIMKKESPAVVHVDGTARPQILRRKDNPEYTEILEEYYSLTGIPSLINTSFNMHEEPIVMTPEDAIKAFHDSRLDALLIGPYIVESLTRK